MFEPLITNSAEYQRVHRLVRKKHGDPIGHRCICGSLADHWAWIQGFDPTDPDNYWPMCRSCHSDYDGTVPSRAKLTEKQVLSIRDFWGTGLYSQKELGDRFGVSFKTISNIVNYRTWRRI